MRKFTIFIMFSLACFSLYGQVRELKIYVAPIEGLGKEADNKYFYNRFIYELVFQYHKVVKSKYDGDYVFKGTIGLANDMPIDASGELVIIQSDVYNPVPENPFPPIRNDFGRREFFSMTNGDKFFFYNSTGADNTYVTSPAETEFSDDDDQKKGESYYFILEMIDNRSGEVVNRQNFIFVTADDSVNELIADVVTNLLSKIPDASSKRGDSRNRWLYIETSAIWTPRILYDGLDSYNLLNFGVKLGVEFHFISFMSFGAGAQIIYEQVETSTDTVSDLTLEVPALLKCTFNLGNNFALEPYGGAAWNYSLGKSIEPSMFSWFAGVQFGIKDKKEIGMFVFDARFSMDFSNSVIPDESIEYQRYNMLLGVGYKFGLIQRKGR